MPSLLERFMSKKILHCENISKVFNMVSTQAFIGVVVGSGIGIATTALLGQAIAGTDFPFRMMWFAPLFGFLGVLIVSITAAFISLRPILKMDSAVVFKI